MVAIVEEDLSLQTPVIVDVKLPRKSTLAFSGRKGMSG